jgi:hypothetical protein
MANILAEERKHNFNAHFPVSNYRALHCKADEMVFLAFSLLVPRLHLCCGHNLISEQGSSLHCAGQAHGLCNVCFLRARALSAAGRAVNHD